MDAKSKNKGNKILLYSFLATLLILSVAVALIIYIPQLQTTQHLPSSYEVNTPDWFKLVPQGSEKITKMNFPRIYQTTSNYSIFTSEILLKVLGFSTIVTTRNSEFSVSVYYPNPNPNSDELALNILKINDDTYSALQMELETKNSQKTTYQNVFIYQVTRYYNNTYLIGYTCVKNKYLLYSDGTYGLELIKNALKNELTGEILTKDPKIKAAIYLLDPKDELAFSHSKFPYPVSDVIATSTKLSYEGEKLVTRILFAFNNTSTAEKNLDRIKQANLNATVFQVIDSYILVVATYDKSTLLGELRSL